MSPASVLAVEGPPRRPFLHPLSGARLIPLLRTVIAHGGVSPRYSGQVAFMMLACLLRWPMCAVETLRVARRVRAVEFDPAPIFIVGHWRSGTTLLHTLLGLDQDFAFPTVLDTFRPYEFYPSPLDVISRTLLLRSLPPTRPMDDVPLDPDLPQEEEWALATMGAPSFLNGMYFPRTLRRTLQEEVLLEGVSPDSLSRWSAALKYYLAKIAAKNPGRRLVLKNPAHSARIRQLKALFPNAKFIHIYRHPLDVFRSTQKMYRRMLPLLSLQEYDERELDAHILWLYPRLMERLLADLENVAPEDRFEIRYEHLVQHPADILGQMYHALALGDFGAVRAEIERAQVRPGEEGTSYLREAGMTSEVRSMFERFSQRLGYERLC